jgi:hypothetical protein
MLASRGKQVVEREGKDTKRRQRGQAFILPLSAWRPKGGVSAFLAKAVCKCLFHFWRELKVFQISQWDVVLQLFFVRTCSSHLQCFSQTLSISYPYLKNSKQLSFLWGSFSGPGRLSIHISCQFLTHLAVPSSVITTHTGTSHGYSYTNRGLHPTNSFKGRKIIN